MKGKLYHLRLNIFNRILTNIRLPFWFNSFCQTYFKT